MSDVALCGNLCPACAAPCERHIDHEGQCKCINCGCRWHEDEDWEGADDKDS